MQHRTFVESLLHCGVGWPRLGPRLCPGWSNLATPTCAQEDCSAEATGILLEAARTLDTLERQLGEWERERLLGGPYDRGGAILTVQASRIICWHLLDLLSLSLVCPGKRGASARSKSAANKESFLCL